MAVRNWMLEQQQRKAEAIKSWRVWEHSTGPISAGGKAAVARNAFDGGRRVQLQQLVKTISRTLLQQRDWLK